MKSRKSTIILLISFFIGLSVLLYPSISSYWNSKTQSEAIVDYESMLAQYKPEDYTAFFEEADDYNRELLQLEEPLLLNKEKLEALAEYLRGFKCVERIEPLPFHKMGEHKWEPGLYRLADTQPPTEADMEMVNAVLKASR